MNTPRPSRTTRDASEAVTGASVAPREASEADANPADATAAPLTDLDFDEIATRAAHLYEYATDDQPLQDEADQLAGTDVPALLGLARRLRAERDEFADRVDTLTAVAKSNKRHVQEMYLELQKAQARVAELETERAKYVGHEPTIAEEMAYLSNCFFAVHQVCDEAERQATRWEHPLPVPEWVAIVRAAASGDRKASPAAVSAVPSRADTLTAAADHLERTNPDRSWDFSEGVDWARDELRRMADEEPQS